MKNSVWYHKLWSRKFDSLPVRDSADAAWADMHKLLNEQLPNGVADGVFPDIALRTRWSKIWAYALAIAVTVAIVLYLTVPYSKNTKKEIVKKNKMVFAHPALTDSNKPENEVSAHDSSPIGDIGTINNPILPYKVGDNGIIEPKNETIANGTGKKGATAVAGLRPFHVAGHLDIKMQKNDGDSASVNAADPSSKYQPAIVLTLDSLLKEAKPDLVMPGRFKLQNVFQPDAAKPKKTKEIKPSKSKVSKVKRKNNEEVAKYSYGVSAGLNVQKANIGINAGVFGSYAFSRKWQLAIGVNVNSKQKVAGEFIHPSYFMADSVPPFTIIDERKITMVDVPLTVVYKLSKTLSIKAGPVLAFTVKQSDLLTTLKPPVDRRDTIYHSAEVNAALSNTVGAKVAVGFTGGISFHLKQFDINGSYQWLKPHNISNSFGAYRQGNQFFKIGVGYRFKN